MMHAIASKRRLINKCNIAITCFKIVTVVELIQNTTRTIYMRNAVRPFYK